MVRSSAVRFDQPDLLTTLDKMHENELDELRFGVIGFGSDANACIRRYSAYESKHSGLSPTSVLGLPLFSVVAQCLNNYLVAQRFEDAKANEATLDTMLDYVLTVRMRPTAVTLRLLAAPAFELRYVAIDWP